MISTDKFLHIIDAVVYISVNATPNPVRGTEISKAKKMPERYFEADLQRLARAGVLKSVRGPKGGYVLAKERRNISLKEIYDAYASANDNKILQPAISAFEKELSKTTLEEIAKPKKDKVDFDI